MVALGVSSKCPSLVCFLVGSVLFLIVHARNPPPPPPPLDLVEMKHQVSLSFAAYCHPLQTVSQFSCFWCNQTKYSHDTRIIATAYDPILDTFGFVGTSLSKLQNHTPVIYVVFRGTQTSSLPNLLDDLVMIQVPPPWIGAGLTLVHDGFLASWYSLKHEIFEGITIAKKMYPNATIAFTGHSLGGAIATIAVVEYRLEHRHSPPPTLTTFGCPRVGNGAFAYFFYYLGLRSHRIVNQNDVIPHLPLKLMDYHHLPTEYWFPNTSSPSYRTCDISGEDRRCSLSVPIDEWSRKDHSTYSLIDLDKGVDFNCDTTKW